MALGVASHLLVGVFVFLSIVSTASAKSYDSHSETYSVRVSRSSLNCDYYDCGYTCYYHWLWWWWWGFRNCRYTSTCRYCTRVYTTRYEPRTRCLPNWSGPSCNIPTCTKVCEEGQSCVPGNQCECLTTGGGVCGAVKCLTKSCYPGTCSSTGSDTCECPPQFAGSNCETFQQTPEISGCQVKLFTGSPEREVAQANCAVEGHTPELTWVGEKTFSRIEASWEVTYSNRFRPVLPTKTAHIEDAGLGVTRTNARVALSSPSFERPIERNIAPECKSDHLTPRENVKCLTKTIRWNEFGVSSLSDNLTYTINVTVHASLGGYKKLRTGGIVEEIGSSTEIQRRVHFIVDGKPPWHCRQATGACTDPAISLAQDAVKKAFIEGEFYNWMDDGSGIDRYQLKIYRLLKSNSDVLETPQRLEKELNVNTSNRFTYTFPSPGVYSLELTVYDKIQNQARARKIVLYDNENHMTTTKEPLIVNETSKESGYRWITSTLREDQDGKSRLTLSWKGRYANPKHVSEGWLFRVEAIQHIIDDDLLKAGGNRTIHAVDHTNGTVGYRLAFKVDKQGGLGLNPGADFVDQNDTFTELTESTWGFFKHDTSKTTLVMSKLTSNDTIVIWMQAFDVIGNKHEDRIQIGYDTSPPAIEESSTVLDENSIDQYMSSILIKARDLQSGIEEVRYLISVSNPTTNITSGTAKAKRLISDGNRRKRSLAVCKRGSSDCYCTGSGECFEDIIRIDIDHCVIDRYYSADRSMTLSYVVMNQAGQPATPRQPFLIKFQNGDPKCRPVTVFTAGTGLAIAVGLLILLVLIVLVIFMVLRWKQNKHPIPDRVRIFATSVRQRINKTENVYSADGHVIYRAKTRHGKVDEDDEDIYVDGSDPGGWRVKRDQVELAETLAEGRFATVKKAYLKKGGETKTVAAKYLPAGASDSDKALLKAKIAFHGNRVPPHDNIVRLIGVIDEGPIMLLEFCDLTLKQWLSSVGKVTTDALEHMLNFTTHIASGMEFLHSKKILHRRLAVRNVLLKKDGVNGLVAKLIGFGTFDESGTEDQAEEATANVAVPLKWLAPETLESVGKGKAIYTQKSDVWSFGVTIWEIYSIGATPYSGKKSAEVEALLKTGYRMPRPDECPPELFDTAVVPCWNVVAKKRPDFKTLCKLIRNFRTGGDQQEGYYTADPTRKTYDDPKERTSNYTTGKKGGAVTTGESLYDDTRK